MNSSMNIRQVAYNIFNGSTEELSQEECRKLAEFRLSFFAQCLSPALEKDQD